jgi:hypothetical protein
VAGSNYRQGTILSWDGSNWNEVPSPSELHNIDDISVISRTDLWVIGNGNSGANVFHWDGLTWQQTELPVSFPNIFHHKGSTILAVSQNDVWAGGRALFHWNGIEWKNAYYDANNGYIVDMEKTPNGKIWALTDTGIILEVTE